MKRLKRIPSFYFTGAITDVKESQLPFYQAAIRILKEFGKVPSEHVGYEKSLEWWNTNMQGVNVRRFDGRGLKDSVALVADITDPTTGGGAEIAEMVSVGAPVKCIYRAGRDVSRYITHWAEIAKNLSVESYGSVEQLENIVRSFAAGVLKESYQPAGAYIVLEGIDGSGKTTQARLLTDYLQKDFDVLLIREPGGTALGERIRSILLDSTLEMTNAGELFLFQAARAELVQHVLRPALDAGRIVVSDRNFLSTFAYQGGGRGFNLEPLEVMNSISMQRLRPDIALVIDIPLELSMSRIGRARDRIEQAKGDFHRNVLTMYRNFPDAEPNTMLIPAFENGKALGIEEVHQRIREKVLSFLKENYAET